MSQSGASDGQRNVLVTGGAGFIGSNLVDMLLDMDSTVKVVVVDDLSTGYIAYVNLSHPKLVFIRGSILDQKMMEEVFVEHAITHVVHLAAMSKVKPSLENVEISSECVQTNIVGTQQLLVLAHKHHVKRFFYAASSTFYGNQPTPFPEDAPFVVSSPYATSKYAGELLVQTFHQIYGLPTTCARFFMVYGPRQPRTGSYAIVTGIFADQRVRGQPLTVDGTGKQYRDFVHVQDICRGVLSCLEETNAIGEIINLGSGKSTSILETAQTVLDAPLSLGCETNESDPVVIGASDASDAPNTAVDGIAPSSASAVGIMFRPQRQHDLAGTLADTHKSENILGWTAQHDFVQDIPVMVAELARGEQHVSKHWTQPRVMKQLQMTIDAAATKMAEQKGGASQTSDVLTKGTLDEREKVYRNWMSTFLPRPKVILTTFTGRRRNLYVSQVCIKEMMKTGVIAEWHLWNFCRDANDMAYIQELVESWPERIKLMPVRDKRYYNEFYEHYTQQRYPNHVIVKGDDDVVFYDVQSFPQWIDRYLCLKDRYPVAWCNTINNGVCAHYQQQMRFLPTPEAEESKDYKLGTFAYQTFCGRLWEDGQLATRLHEYFIDHADDWLIQARSLSDAEAVHHHKVGDRWSINCFAVHSSNLDIFDRVRVDDEHEFTVTVPMARKLQNYAYADMSMTVVHLGFSRQREKGLDEPKVLRRYWDLNHRLWKDADADEAKNYQSPAGGREAPRKPERQEGEKKAEAAHVAAADQAPHPQPRRGRRNRRNQRVRV